MDKVCTQCKQGKSHTEYFKHDAGRDGLHPKCKKCMVAQQKHRRKTKGDNATYRYRYGKTVAELTAIKEQQNNACAICKEPFIDTFNSVVDHCHQQNKFRGFLCRRCNSGLGMFRDNIEYLTNAIGYLKCSST